MLEVLYSMHLHYPSIVREFDQNLQHTLQHRTGVQLTQRLTIIRWGLSNRIGTQKTDTIKTI